MRTATSPRTAATVVLTLGALLLAAACGDNITGGSPDDDNDNDDEVDVDAEPGTTADAPPSPDAFVNDPQNPNGAGPAPIDLGNGVDLGQADAYVLLAKSGITNVTGSLITGGNVGLSPITFEALTGFSNVMDDAGGQFATSDTVVGGNLYFTKHDMPTPANLITAVLSMEAGYTDGATRTNPDELNFQDGEIGGETLAPGFYKWGSGVTIPTDVTFAGGPNDVWILTIAGTLGMSANMEVILTGNANPANIFWVVAEQVTIEPGAHFEGIILGKTGITLQTNASWDGRGMAQTMIALDDNMITAP